MFLIEGLPAIMLGFFCFWFLPNRPADASWLTRAEKEVVVQDLAHDESVTEGHLSIRQFLADKRLWLLCLLYFTIIVGHYTVSFWLPTMVQSAGVNDPLQNGLLTGLPFAAAAITIVVLGRSADRTRKRRRHVLIPMVVGAVALALSPLAGSNLVLSMSLLCIATAGLMSATAMFWSIPPMLLSGVWAAAGIAVINSMGNIAGFASPFVMGWILEETKSLQAGLNTMAAIVLLGVLLMTLLPARQVDR
jgi:nitrate/nitrite transporter NarK